MANVVIVNPNLYRIPYINIEFEMTPVEKKVIATALATILLLGVQFSLSWPITFFISFALASLTYVCEKVVDREKIDWFNTDIDKTHLIFIAGVLILKSLIVTVVSSSLGIPLGFAEEGIKEIFLNDPFRMFLISCFCAPFSEEVLFRGFVLERVEDLLHIIDRYKCIKISKSVQKFVAQFIQAAIFSAAHINQKIEEGMKGVVAFSFGLMGLVLGLTKDKQKSLITSIAKHSANNMGATIHILKCI